MTRCDQLEKKAPTVNCLSCRQLFERSLFLCRSLFVPPHTVFFSLSPQITVFRCSGEHGEEELDKVLLLCYVLRHGWLAKVGELSLFATSQKHLFVSFHVTHSYLGKYNWCKADLMRATVSAIATSVAKWNILYRKLRFKKKRFFFFQKGLE